MALFYFLLGSRSFKAKAEIAAVQFMVAISNLNPWPKIFSNPWDILEAIVSIVRMVFVPRTRIMR